ncbi:Kelch repeat-containing protein [Haliangium ochraceum DSM 14365]|uniref:Kelch repeat-containing protein n=2 Tax=Haliangium ochraceum TaxID=80816 RepID=D0LT53_HALO1|nr:Kelch repeat-containing protein [Haliangium ochraceum DSM 14365]
MLIMDHSLHRTSWKALLAPALPIAALTGLSALGLHACGGGVQTPPSAPAASAEATAPTPAAPPAPVLDASVPLLPQPVTSFGAAVYGGDLYVLGGYHGKPHGYSREGQSGDLYRARVGDSSSTWEKLPGIEPMQSLSMVAHDSGLVRIGGMRATNRSGEPSHLLSTAEVALFSPADASWSELPALPAPRSSHDAAILGDTVYVLGGWQLAGGADSATWHDTGAALSLAEDGATWKPFEVPFQRRALGVAAAGGRIIAVGGMSAAGEVSRRVDLYDPASGSWTRGPDYPAPAFGIALAGVGDAVYASGMDGTVYRLDIARAGADWEAAGTLAFPRFFHRIEATDDALLMLGGILGMNSTARVRAVERVPLSGDGDDDSARITRFTLAAPGPAKNRMGLFLHRHTLYGFGGNRSLGQHDFEPDDFLDDAYALNLGSLTWQSMAAFPTKRQTMQTALNDGGKAGATGFAIGGFGHDGEMARTFADAFVYDFEHDAWKSNGEVLPAPRSQFGLARRDDALWIFGGLDYDPTRGDDDQFRHLVDVLRAPVSDLSSGFQPSGVTLPQPRRAFGGALLGERYYLVGGMRENFQFVESCDVYDFESETWSQIPAPRSVRISAQLIPLDGKLYLVGGSSRDASGALAPDPSIEMFDPDTGRWSLVIDELPVVTKHMRAFAYGTRLLVYSAHSERDEVHLMLVDPGSR